MGLYAQSGDPDQTLGPYQPIDYHHNPQGDRDHYDSDLQYHWSYVDQDAQRYLTYQEFKYVFNHYSKKGWDWPPSHWQRALQRCQRSRRAERFARRFKR